MDKILLRAVAAGLFLLLVLIISANREQLSRSILFLRRQAAPCSVPVSYAAGRLDDGFGLTRAEFLSALREAESAWEAATGADLFVAADRGAALTINLVYDEKQATAERLRAMGAMTAVGRSALEELKAQQEAVAAKAAADRAALVERAGRYTQRQRAYEAAARSAGRGDQAALRAERDSLAAEYASLRAAEADLNALVDSLNSTSGHMERQVEEHNRRVEEVNREGQAVGRTEEGVYRGRGVAETIDIYQYTDRPQLVRVLMHELGHAAGFAHVADPQAVMHALFSGQRPELTGADLGEFRRVCRKK